MNGIDYSKYSESQWTKESVEDFERVADHIGVKASKVAKERLSEGISGLIGVELSKRQIAYYKPEDFKKIVFLNKLLKTNLQHTPSGKIDLNAISSNEKDFSVQKLNFLINLLKGDIFENLTQLMEKAFKYATNYQNRGFEVFKKDFELLLAGILRSQNFSSQAVNFLKEFKERIPQLADDVDDILNKVISPFDDLNSNRDSYRRVIEELNHIPKESWDSLPSIEVSIIDTPKQESKSSRNRLREIWNDFILWLTLLFTRPSQHIFTILKSTKTSGKILEILTDFPKMRIDNALSEEAFLTASQAIPNGRKLIKQFFKKNNSELIQLNKEEHLINSQLKELQAIPSTLCNLAIDELKNQQKELQKIRKDILEPLKKALKELIDHPENVDIEAVANSVIPKESAHRHLLQQMRQRDRNDFVNPLAKLGKMSNEIGLQMTSTENNLNHLALRYLNSPSNEKFPRFIIDDLQNLIEGIILLESLYKESKFAYSQSTCEAIKATINSLRKGVEYIQSPMDADGSIINDNLINIAINEILNRDHSKWINFEQAQQTFTNLNTLLETENYGKIPKEKIFQAYNHLKGLLPKIEEHCDYEFTKAYLNAQGGILRQNTRSGAYTKETEGTKEIPAEESAKKLAAIIRKRASIGFQDFEITKDLLIYASGASKELGITLRQLQRVVELREFCQQYHRSVQTGFPIWQRWTGESINYLCSEKIPFGEGWNKIEPQEAMAKSALILSSRLTAKDENTPLGKEVMSLIEVAPVIVWDRNKNAVTTIVKSVYNSMPKEKRNNEFPLLDFDTALGELEKFSDECRKTDLAAESLHQKEARTKKAFAFAALLRRSKELDPNVLIKHKNALNNSINSILQVIQDKRDGIGDQLGVLQFITEFYKSITNKIPIWKKIEDDRVSTYQTLNKQPKGEGWVEMHLNDFLTLFPRLTRKWGNNEKLKENDPLAQQLWLIAAHVSPILLWDKEKNIAIMKDRTFYDSFPALERARIFERVTPAQSLELASEFIEDCEKSEWPPDSYNELEQCLTKGVALSVLLQKTKDDPSIDQNLFKDISGNIESALQTIAERYRMIMSEAPRLARKQKISESQQKVSQLLDELKNVTPPDMEVKIYRHPSFNHLVFATKKTALLDGLKEMDKGSISIKELRTLSPDTPEEKIALFEHVCHLYAEIDHPSRRSDSIPYPDRLYLEQQINELFQNVLESLWNPQNRNERLKAFTLLERLLDTTKELKNQWLQNREKVSTADTLFLSSFLERLKLSLFSTMVLASEAPKSTQQRVIPQEILKAFYDDLHSLSKEVNDFTVTQIKDVQAVKSFQMELNTYREHYLNDIKPSSDKEYQSKLEPLFDEITKKLEGHNNKIKELATSKKPLKIVNLKEMKKTAMPVAPKQTLDTLIGQIQSQIKENKYNKAIKLKSSLNNLRDHIKKSKLNSNEIEKLTGVIAEIKRNLTEEEFKFLESALSLVESEIRRK